jgi:hypothetical protein
MATAGTMRRVGGPCSWVPLGSLSVGVGGGVPAGVSDGAQRAPPHII